MIRVLSLQFSVSRTMATYTAFVYGTLKTGQPNHREMTNPLNGVAKYIGKGYTLDQFPLVIASEYNIPFLLYKKGTGKQIQGDIFEIDEKMLATLDDFEDHPKFYERDMVNVKLTENDQQQKQDVEKQCWCYFLKKYKPKMLELPFLESYDSKGDHGLVYVERGNSVIPELASVLLRLLHGIERKKSDWRQLKLVVQSASLFAKPRPSPCGSSKLLFNFNIQGSEELSDPECL